MYTCIMDWKHHINFLTFLITVCQFVSVLFVFTPVAVLAFVLNYELSNCVLGVSSVVEGCADFLIEEVSYVMKYNRRPYIGL